MGERECSKKTWVLRLLISILTLSVISVSTAFLIRFVNQRRAHVEVTEVSSMAGRAPTQSLTAGLGGASVEQDFEGRQRVPVVVARPPQPQQPSIAASSQSGVVFRNGNPSRTTTTSETQVPLLQTPQVAGSVSSAFKICIIGDVPYSPIEACMLPYTIGDRRRADYPYGLKPSDCEILVHLGDIRDGQSSEGCQESLYQQIASIFSASPIPTFFVPGENGWLDCTDADQSYLHWTQHLFRLNEAWSMNPNVYDVRRSTIRRDARTVRSELFSIYLRDSRRILVIGLSLPGQGKGSGKEVTDAGNHRLMQDNVSWIESRLSLYGGSRLRGVVLCGHSTGSPYFMAELKRIVRTHPNTVFWFLQDSHRFHDETVPIAKNQPQNLIALATDDTITPTIVTLDPLASTNPQSTMSYDRGCDCTTDHRPTRLLERGDQCHAFCVHAYRACPPCIGTEPGIAPMTWPKCTGGRQYRGGPDSRGRYDVCSLNSSACNGMFDKPFPNYTFKSSAASLSGRNSRVIPDGIVPVNTKRYRRLQV